MYIFTRHFFSKGDVSLPPAIIVSYRINWILGSYRTHYTWPFQLDTLLVTWWISELVCLPVKGLVAPGIRPSPFGSSGTLVKNWSNFNLKSSNPQFDMFLMSLGTQLKSLGPATWKLCSLKDLTEAFPFSLGMFATLPFLPLSLSWDQLTPGFGTSPWIIFHI